MRLFIGFDDTDLAGAPMGTGKLARRFETALPEQCRLWGVVRQQLLVHPDIPYTSHNSAACLVVDSANGTLAATIIDTAAEYLCRTALPGSDPGLCVAMAGDASLGPLAAFGSQCVQRKVTQKEAMAAAAGSHLSGHGGTCDGIIGAAAAVGLTARGNGGRFIEFGKLRDLPGTISAGALSAAGIAVVSTDRDALPLPPEATIHTLNWVRPWLIGQRPVLLVRLANGHRWEPLYGKRPGHKAGGN